MKEINKLINLLINYTENHYKIKFSIKVNMEVYVKFLQNMLMKTKMNLFYIYEYKNQIKPFPSNKLKFNPRT